MSNYTFSGPDMPRIESCGDLGHVARWLSGAMVALFDAMNFGGMMGDFRCTKCNKHPNDWEMDFRQRVATCKTCSLDDDGNPNFPAERVTGPWLMKNGQPRPVSTRAE